MIQNVLTHIGGIGGYGILSLCLFLAVFLGVVVWALRLKRTDLDSMRMLPLEDETPFPDRLNSPPGTRHE